MTYKDAFQNLTDFFGADKPLQAITPQDASDFEHYLRTAAYNGAGYSKATVKKRIQRVKQFFIEARRLKWIIENPFDGIQGGNLANPKKWLYIPQETVLDVMANTPDLQTRARIALCRFAGARGKSEFDSLEWNSNWIQWSADGKQGTVRLHRQKTEDSGYSDTIIPMVPELEGALRDLFDSAAPGTVKVFKPVNNPGKVIKDKFFDNKIDILEPYNLRRSYCRDLMEKGLDPKSYEYYAGHSLKVAMQYYQSWDDLRAQKAAPKVLEALTGSDSRPNRRAIWRAVESDLESSSRLSTKGCKGYGSGRLELNQRPFDPQSNALSRLRHAPVEEIQKKAFLNQFFNQYIHFFFFGKGGACQSAQKECNKFCPQNMSASPQ